MYNERLKLIIFSLIGIFNTVFDIAVYVILLDVTHSFIFSNIVATSLALTGSYVLNSKVTFKNKSWSPRSLLLFVLVTLFGLWVLQTSAIYVLTQFANHSLGNLWHHFGPLHHLAQQLLPKLAATVITFVWNYLWYNKVIFRDQSIEQSALLALDDL
jgi:putative flippase GtrA